MLLVNSSLKYHFRTDKKNVKAETCSSIKINSNNCVKIRIRHSFQTNEERLTKVLMILYNRLRRTYTSLHSYIKQNNSMENVSNIIKNAFLDFVLFEWICLHVGQGKYITVS